MGHCPCWDHHQCSLITCPKWFSSPIHIAMGWVCIPAISRSIAALPAGGFAWLLAGGIIYTAGGIIYALKLPIFNSRHRYFGPMDLPPVCHGRQSLPLYDDVSVRGIKLTFLTPRICPYYSHGRSAPPSSSGGAVLLHIPASWPPVLSQRLHNRPVSPVFLTSYIWLQCRCCGHGAVF